MKKLIILTAVAILMATTAGCECGGLFRRGALFPRMQSNVVCADPCSPCAAPCATPCAPSAVMGGCAPTMTTTPTITPGPETYVPAPTQ